MLSYACKAGPLAPGPGRLLRFARVHRWAVSGAHAPMDQLHRLGFGSVSRRGTSGQVHAAPPVMIILPSV